MSKGQLATPVAFIIFNRPELARRVFEEIRRARPTKLLVVADGPRPNHPNDVEKCAKAREVINDVDWPCEVLMNYSKVNLGCRHRPASGLDWVFGQVEEAIVLEDDCLPHPTFFAFCEELLEKYREDERVSYISGNNFQFGRPQPPYSYYFSLFGCSWGWASWRRVWRNVDITLRDWPVIRDSGLLVERLQDEQAAHDYTECLDATFKEQIDGWDYQFALACWRKNQLSIVPNVNLISNIGHSHDATHTKKADSRANVPTKAMEFPLQHPPTIARNPAEDRYTHQVLFGTPWERFKRKAKSLLRPLFKPSGSFAKATSIC